MKLLHKLAPVAIFASTAAVVVPFATSCGKGWTSFSALTFNEQKYQNNIHEAVSEGWDNKTIWKDFGNSKVAFDTDVRFYSTNVLKEMIEAELDPDDFPTFDVKYRNFKTELDDNDTPYVSYDLECSLVLDYILYTSQSNAADVYRDRAYLSLSMRHIPVLIGCMPWPLTNEAKHLWYFGLDTTESQWTNESNLNYSLDYKEYLRIDGKEYYKEGNKIAYEMNTNVGINLPPDPFFNLVTSLGSYCYQKVAQKY